jgi:hypothetical protein
MPPKEKGFRHLGRPVFYNHKSPCKWDFPKSGPLPDYLYKHETPEELATAIANAKIRDQSAGASLNISHNRIDGETGYFSRLQELLEVAYTAGESKLPAASNGIPNISVSNTSGDVQPNSTPA